MIRYVTQGMAKRLPQLIIIILAFTIPLRASPSQHVHEHPLVSNQIDGSTNPEKIQDKDAYRLFLLSATTGPNPSPDEVKRQQAVLRQASVTPDDEQKVLQILAEFRSKYDALMAAFNTEAEAKAKNGQGPDIKPFIISRDTLVLSTKDNLSTTLGAQKFARFHEHVQNEKAKMKVAIEE